ncbi:MAG TPA: ABC transporter permease [Anaeromyxobacter sp.]|nr:ABC transporter permease [Anaeromyxobacter sp.]
MSPTPPIDPGSSTAGPAERDGASEALAASGADWLLALRSRLRRPMELVSRGIIGQLVALALVFIIFSVGTKGTYLSLRNVLTILGLAGIPMIVCLGIHLVIVIGGMDLSTEGVISLVAVICGLLIKNSFTPYDIGFWVVPVAVAIGALAGLVGGVLSTAARMPSFIATLGMWWVAQGLSVVVGRGNSVKMLDPRFQVITNGDTLGLPNTILIAAALFAVLWLVQRRTRFGRYMYAIGGDEALARQAGIKIARVKVAVFTITGAIYGFAAMLLASRLAATNPRIGNGQLFPAMTAVAVGGVSLSGGVGGALNAVLGTLIVVALNDGMVVMKVSPYVQNAVNGIVLILAVAVTIDRKKIGIIK